MTQRKAAACGMALAVFIGLCSIWILRHPKPIEVTRIRAVVSTPKPTIKPTPAPVHRKVLRKVSRPLVGPLRHVQGSIWDCIALHESGSNWADNSYEGVWYEGGLHFLHETWVSAGGRKYAEHAYQATREQQIAIAQSWLAQTSWAQWPNTSRICGVR